MALVSQQPLRRDAFSGFPDPDAAIQFFLELQAEQNRAWFAAHRADYERLCRRPLELLMAELRARLADVYPGLAAVEPHIFRIQRDTRFARDKSPYKTNVAASLPLRAGPPGSDGHAIPSLYLNFGLDGEVVAAGCWHLPPERLGRYRAAVAAGPGAALQRIVDGLVSGGWALASMEALKRVPAPYPADHPRGELLKRKGLAVSHQPADGLSATPAFADWAAARLGEAAPLLAWLDQHVA